MESAFSSFKNSQVAKAASLKYDGTPFEYVIDNAKKGEKDALYYLVLQSLKQLASAFYTFYKKNWKTMDRDESSHEFFNDFLIKINDLLLEGEGPVFTFNQDKFAEKDDAFLFNRFGYYMYQYAMALAKKKGEEAQEEESEMSSVDVNENMADERKVSTGPFSGKEKFMKFLGKKFPQGYTVMIMLADRVPPEDIWTGMGVTKQRFYQITAKVAKMYDEFKKRVQNESVIMAVKTVSNR